MARAAPAISRDLFFLSVGGAIGSGLALTPAQAYPALTPVQAQPSTVTTVQSGQRQYGYRRYHPRHYGYRTHYREYNDPDVYSTGSNRWWVEMDRLQRGGRR